MTYFVSDGRAIVDAGGATLTLDLNDRQTAWVDPGSVDPDFNTAWLSFEELVDACREIVRLSELSPEELAKERTSA